MGPFTETKWVVCHGPGVVHFSELTVGSSITTGQPNCEHFDVQDDAARRAFELNYTGFRHFKLEDEYEDGEYVVFLDNLYRALDKVEPYTHDPNPDPDEPVEEPPFPNRDFKDWTLITYDIEEEL